MDIEVLRRSTAADHDAIEGAVPLMSERLTPECYVAVLERMHGVVAAWERMGESAAPVWMQPMLQRRKRRALIERDLRFLRRSSAPDLDDPALDSPDQALDAPAMPVFGSDAEFLGAMYVMEGSRMGGLLIAKHVEAVLRIEAGRGDAYFRGDGGETRAMWREFLEVLRTQVPDEETEEVIRGARRMFGLFGAWMRGDGVEFAQEDRKDMQG